MIYPCKNCNNRHEACHATCEQYLIAKDKHFKLKHNRPIIDVVHAERVATTRAKIKKLGKGGHNGRQRKGIT